MSSQLSLTQVLIFIAASAAGAVIGSIAVRQLERWAAGNSLLIKPGP